MTEAYTKVADVIQPTRFNPYMRLLSTKVNAFFRAGIIATVPAVAIAGEGGTQVNMPFWNALTQRAQLLDDTTTLEVRKITAGKDVAVLHGRALIYGGTDMAAALAGDDPMQAVAAGLADNWSWEFNALLLATLRGAMGAMQGEDLNFLDISGLSGAAAYIDGASFIDAGQTMGDAKQKIVGVAMHSAVESYLRKNDLIEDIPDSEGKATLPFFQGKRVIVDDEMAADSGGVYTTYLFGEGAIGFAEGSPKVPTETDRNPLINSGEDYLVSRRHFVLHPRGIKWIGTPQKQTPSDAEVANSGNWTRVYDNKDIKIVRFLHKIG